MKRSQLADKARRLQIPLFELIIIIREDVMQQATPKDSDCLGFGEHGVRTFLEVQQVDPRFCLWVEQVEGHQSHQQFKRFSSWLKIQSIYQWPSLVLNRKMTEQLADDVFAGAWSGELGRELCGIAEAPEKNTVMNTLSSEEVRWMDELTRHSTAGPPWDDLIKQPGPPAEKGAHAGAMLCSVMEELAGKGTAV